MTAADGACGRSDSSKGGSRDARAHAQHHAPVSSATNVSLPTAKLMSLAISLTRTRGARGVKAPAQLRGVARRCRRPTRYSWRDGGSSAMRYAWQPTIGSQGHSSEQRSANVAYAHEHDFASGRRRCDGRGKPRHGWRPVGGRGRWRTVTRTHAHTSGEQRKRRSLGGGYNRNGGGSGRRRHARSWGSG